MDQTTKDWIDISIKALALGGVYIAAINYRGQRIIKKGEWLQSLFEKFYESDNYKEVRRWIDNNEIEKKIRLNDTFISDEKKRFTDFLNFFEFIAHLKLNAKYQEQMS